MNCKLCADLLHEYVERTLSPEMIEDLNRHLERCEACRVFVKTYMLTVTLSRNVETPCCVSPEMFDRLRTILIDRLINNK